MTPNKYIFFFDIDGTLYDHFTGTPQAALDTLEQLKKAGHIVCLNTGRGAWFVPEPLDSFPFDGIVAGTGAYVAYQGKVLQDICFATPFVHLIYDEFIKHNIPFTLEAAEYNYMNSLMAEHTLKLFDRPPEDEHSQALRLQPSKFEIQDNMSKAAADKPIHKISFYATADSLSYITKLLGDNVSLTMEKEDSYGFLYGEAVPAGCCKSNGAALLASYARIPYSRTIAVGDGYNDLDILKWASIGIAMGGSEDAVLEAADYVCLPLQEGGICNIPELLSHILDCGR